MKTTKRQRRRMMTFCSPCGVTYSARRKLCDCGEPVREGTAPAHLECGHCGDVAIESESGLFWDDDGGPCSACGFPGHVRVDEDHAYWETSDEDGTRCKQVDCDECVQAVSP